MAECLHYCPFWEALLVVRGSAQCSRDISRLSRTLEFHLLLPPSEHLEEWQLSLWPMTAPSIPPVTYRLSHPASPHEHQRGPGKKVVSGRNKQWFLHRRLHSHDWDPSSSLASSYFREQKCFKEVPEEPVQVEGWILWEERPVELVIPFSLTPWSPVASLRPHRDKLLPSRRWALKSVKGLLVDTLTRGADPRCRVDHPSPRAAEPLPVPLLVGGHIACPRALPWLPVKVTWMGAYGVESQVHPEGVPEHFSCLAVGVWESFDRVWCFSLFIEKLDCK